jgi:hypothetical protein
VVPSSLWRVPGRKYVGLTVWPIMCALPIQERWVCGRTTETVCPAACKVLTRECT